MSSTPRTYRNTPQQSNESETIEDDTEISTLLGVLEDEDCRAILEATSETAYSASELCEVCGLSSSTAYRKIDQLTEAGLLEESIRLCSSGSHTSEYSLAVTDLEISIGGSVELTITAEDSPQVLAAD